jgi:hypothetical protein
MKEVKGRNGGTIKRSEKGDPAPPGAGRPVGSISFKKLANQILDGKISREDAEGKKMLLTRKEAMVLGMIEDALNDEDPNTRLKAGFGIWDRLEKEATDVNVNMVKDGGEMDAARFAALKALAEQKENED